MNSQKRTACNECRQQKLKCDLTANEGIDCSRCRKLQLDCKLEPSFKRARKRKSTQSLEHEIVDLQSRLSSIQESAANAQASSPSIIGRTTSPTLSRNGTCQLDQPSIGITTRPHEHELEAPPTISLSSTQTKALGTAQLEEDEVQELVTEYFTHYHNFLPILNPGRSYQAVFEASPLLFWSIIAIACRRAENQPTLLNQIAQPVTDLLWKQIRTPPHTLEVVQAILLLCIWPFPTSSSSNDQSYTLASIAINVAIQMGLHRPINQHDFVKYRFRLADAEVEERISTWNACNIVANQVSIGVGLQSAARLGDCATRTSVLESLVQIERFKLKVSNSFTANMTDRRMLKPLSEHLHLYTSLAEEFRELQLKLQNTNTYVQLQLLDAQLHLEAFTLSDEPTTVGYDDRVIALHDAASRLIQQVLHMDTSIASTKYLPFQVYQIFAVACFVLLKLLRNDYFSTLINASASRKLFHKSISTMRRMSVRNNDIPARVSDVLAYLWNLADHAVIGGQGQAGLQLQIKSRLSVSVVYDSLWKWRDQFRVQPDRNCQDEPPSEENDFDSNAFQQFDPLPGDDLFWDWFR